MNRYLYMLTWGIKYTFFSLCSIYLYSILEKYKIKVLNIKLYCSDVILCGILIILSGIRCNVGTDFFNYYTIYNTILDKFSSFFLVLKTGPGGGFFVLSYIIKKYINFPYAIFWIIAIFLNIYFFYYIRKYSSNVLISFSLYLLLGFYMMGNNIIKQFLSMNMIIMFYIEFQNKKYLRALLFGILGIYFHITSLIVIFLMVISIKIRPTKINFYLSCICGILSLFFYKEVINIFFCVFPFLNGFAKYLTWERNIQLRLILAVSLNTFLYIILTYLLIKYKNLIIKNSLMKYKMISLMILAIPINIISLQIWILFRISLFFYQFIIILIPTIFDRVLKKHIFFYMTIISIFCVLNSIFLGDNEYYNYFTYLGNIPKRIKEFNYDLGFIKNIQYSEVRK